MSGWDLKEGALVKYRVSDDELWSLFNFVFSDACRKTNTYKFGLIKSICDQIYDLFDSGLGFFLSYEKLFSKFTENYWNLVNKYGLKQMSYNGKSEFSKIETIIKESVKAYSIPENVSFQSLINDERNAITKKVASECKRNVIGALYNDFEGKLYSFNLKGEGICLSAEAYNFISKYKNAIEDLNYYAWARFLEKVNEDEVLIRVLEKLDLSTPKRNDLSVYRELLYKEFQENTCFYCGKKLDKNIHVDHFIPWTFVKNDNLWNFVLICPRCNIRKGSSLVSREYIKLLEQRNKMLTEASLSPRDMDIVTRELKGYSTGLLGRMWEYARLSGVREKIII